MPTKAEGLKVARFMMVLSSISPLFVLWAIRGSKLLADKYLFSFCAAMVLLPNLFLWLRITTARKLNLKRELVVGSAEDHRDHLLVYLFAMLLPFYPIDTHYMNLLFAIRGYRVFTISPPTDDNPLSGRTTQVLITPRVSISSGEHIVAYRLSDTVYFEVKK